MKKIILFVGVILMMGCSNQEVLKIEDDTPIPIKASKEDSYIFLDEIDHRPTSKYMIYNKENEELKIIIKTRKNDVDTINIILDDGTQKTLESIGTQGDSEYFAVNINKKINDEIHYYFELIDADFKYFYGEKSSYSRFHVENFEYLVEDNQRKLPDWVVGMEWYSIYIDTFKDGDSDNTPIYSEFGPEYYFSPTGRLKDGTLKSELITPTRWRTKGDLQGFEITPWGSDWNKPSYTEIEAQKKYFSYAIKNTRRFGGDLQGIMEKIDYLKEIGVEGINISPVFYSYSGHKLDTIDFGHISPDIAVTSKTSYRELEDRIPYTKWTESDLLFQKLVDEIHKNNMRIVVDINFAYVSPEFFAYQDYLKNGETSKYKNWFLVEGDKKNPDIKKVKLNLDDKELQDYLISTTLKWVKGNNSKGIDGYFVKNNISEEFLRRWKGALLKENPEFILVGERTDKNEDYIGKNGFDILGSYELGIWLQGLFGDKKDSIEDVKNSINIYSLRTPRWNLIESYDTNRFYSGLVNDRKEYDRLNNYGKDDYINIRPDLVDKNAIEELKLAILIQMTIDGSPIIYYGSEKGMWGADTPDNRKPMMWDDVKFEKESDTLKKYWKNRGRIAKIFNTDMMKDDISYDVKTSNSLEEWYKKIVEFRNFDKELIKKGNLQVLDLNYTDYKEDGSIVEVKENDVLAYKREYEGRSAIIVVNTSPSKKTVKIPVDGSKAYTDFYNSDKYSFLGSKIKVDLDGYGYKVLYRKINFD